MSSLTEIEAAAEALPQDEQRQLLNWLALRVNARPAKERKGHSVLDIPAVSVGKILQLPDADDDIYGEMLEDRI